MVLFNHATREMTAKIVYYGPGLCGKTTNLLVIFDKLDPKNRGKMLSLATKTDRTLFFDLLPVDIGKVGPFNLKIQLYTVPGQVFYNETRKLVLKGSDAVVFVADSQPSMVESNRDSFQNLLENLQENQLDPNDIPIVIQYNKRDIPGVLSVDELQERLQFDGYPYVEASAVQGEGVMETFKLVSKVTAKHLVSKLQGKPAAKPAAKREAAKISVKAPTPLIQEEEPEEIEGTSPLEPDFISPLPEAPFEQAPDEQSYEKVEEVSLEELLEGRERPATMSGNIAIPVPEEEIESMEEAEMLPLAEAEPEPEPLDTSSAVSIPDVTPLTDAVSSQELSSLRQEIDELRRDQQRLRQLLTDIASAIVGALPSDER
jgi:signal recognition particle receptor subunit beta